MSKWIEIRDGGVSATGKTKVWDIFNIRTKEKVGEIRWYGGWRKYAFFPTMPKYQEDYMIFDSECLDMIASYLKQVNRAKKEKKV